MTKICTLKKRKRRRQGKTPNLMANDRFQASQPLKDSKLGGQWKEKKKHL